MKVLLIFISQLEEKNSSTTSDRFRIRLSRRQTELNRCRHELEETLTERQ